jgi:hypothetical protein
VIYEYREVQVIMGSVRQLNELGAQGWRVVMLLPGYSHERFLLERELTSLAPLVEAEINAWTELVEESPC